MSEDEATTRELTIRAIPSAIPAPTGARVRMVSDAAGGRALRDRWGQRIRLLGRESIVDVRRLVIVVAVGLPLVMLEACAGAAKTSRIPPTTSSVPSTTSTSASGVASVTQPVPALQTHNPTVAVAPATGLFDDQEVLVTITGFGVGGKVWLSQCGTVSSVNDEGCGQGLPEQTLLVTDDNGMGSIAFQVQSSAAAQPNDRSDLDPCVNNCVLVATEGGGFGLAFSSLHFVGSTPSDCTTAQLHVSAGKVGAATGHSGFPLLFSNKTSQECRLSGYPGVALLYENGRPVIQAQREPSGFIGGLPSYSGGPLPAIGLASGETASALVEGDDVPPSGVAPCGQFTAVLVTPPNATQSVRVDVGVPGCSDLQVHPVVLGSTGQG